MPNLPTPLRATLGLVAKTIEDARALPTRMLELPVVAVTTGMRLSMRVQQQYTGLVARGDDVLAGRQGGSDEPPSWATFDDDDDDDDDARESAPGPWSAGDLNGHRAADGYSDDEEAALPPVRRHDPARRRNLPRDRAPSAFDVVENDSDSVNDSDGPDDGEG